MADDDFPIDINYAKIADWLVRLLDYKDRERQKLRESWTRLSHHHRHQKKTL